MHDPWHLNELADDGGDHDKLEKLHAMFKKIPSLTDDDIAAGIQLTTAGLDKIGRKFGIDRSKVELLIAKLRTRLHSDDLIREDDGDQHGRFTYEQGFTNDVEIFDTETSERKALTGSKGTQFLTAIERTSDPQAVMAQFFMAESLNEETHSDALARTGFWGSQGAGCLVLAQSTGRILVAHRSDEVEQPNTWGSWGGAIDPGENPQEATLRELSEEAGYHGEIVAVQPLYVFQKGTFRYSNFLVTVPDEFDPHLDWETQGYRWCVPGRWPNPKHFGFEAILKDAASVRTIKDAVKAAKASAPLKEDDEHPGDASFADEIAAPHGGTFNFQWSIRGQHGVACVGFSKTGQPVKVLSAMTADGSEINLHSLGKELLRQAAQKIKNDEI